MGQEKTLRTIMEWPTSASGQIYRAASEANAEGRMEMSKLSGPFSGFKQSPSSPSL
jgi:hypothetical protein